ncbi:hypothetical protein MSUIS_06020 [Mycoplasma suis KI3806]|uniref:Uncharacterized protein n=1 Tax=Mycoplasma suis (strain KI_3806) TaxID=708248 RepID=F0V214_MYCS3|nr:hypothetical protein [Mycoplasma suis]CBZ40695.1 hypothetical protein MSUIS_06020 [Mycoplasma suis KI3806]
MFLFSKTLTAGILLAGASGFSAYLIPYGLGNFSLFSGVSSSDNKDSEKFLKEEGEKLKTLNLLWEEFTKAIKNSVDLKDLKNKGLEEFLNSITSEESKLKENYKKHSDVMGNLSEVSSWLKDQRERKLKVLSVLESLSSERKLLKQFNEFFEKWEGVFESIEDAINEGNRNNPAGGAATNNEKLRPEAKQKKH